MLLLVHTISVFYCAQLGMKCLLGISNFIEEISIFSYSDVSLSLSLFCIDYLEKRYHLFLLFFGTLHSDGYLLLSPLPFTSFLFSAICKASSDNYCLFAFLLLEDGLNYCLLYNVTNLHP